MIFDNYCLTGLGIELEVKNRIKIKPQNILNIGPFYKVTHIFGFNLFENIFFNFYRCNF